MEFKKDPRLDLARFSKLFLNVGFVVSLTVCLIAFEWKTYEDLSRVEKLVPSIITEPTLDNINVSLKPLAPPVVPKPKQPEPDLTKDLSKINMTDVTIETALPPATADVPLIIPPSVISGNVSDVIPEETANIPVDQWALEKQPEGQEAFYKYISKNLKYPQAAVRGNIEGKVFVQFVINTDGSLTDIVVIKGIGFGCDEEAVRIIKNAPKWTPGKQRGKPVRVRMSMPIAFKLNK